MHRQYRGLTWLGRARCTGGAADQYLLPAGLSSLVMEAITDLEFKINSSRKLHNCNFRLLSIKNLVASRMSEMHQMNGHWLDGVPQRRDIKTFF